MCHTALNIKLRVVYAYAINTFNLGESLVARLLVARDDLARVQAHLQQLLGLVQQLARERDQKVCAVTDLGVMQRAAGEQNTRTPARGRDATMQAISSTSLYGVYLRLLLLAGKHQHLCGGVLRVWWARISFSDRND